MRIKANKVTYYYEKIGSGFPLFLLHGFTGSAKTWIPFTPVLTKTSEMILLDIVGHGQSDSPEDIERYDILEVAADISLLMDKLGIDQADFLGYSMGGRLAITFAMNYPNKVRKLVLESTTPGLKSEKEKVARRQTDFLLANKIMSEGLESFVNYWEKIPLFKTQMNLSEATREIIRRQRMQNNPAGLANSLLRMGTGSQPSWWESLKSLNCEVLILTGELDQKFCQIGEEMTKIIPKAEMIQFKDSGHAIHVEVPEKFGTIVSGFLSEKAKTLR